MTRGHGKAANIIGSFGDKIGQRIICAPIITLHLLAQRMQTRALRTARFISENHNIIAIARGRPKADNRFGGQPFFINHLVEHGLRVIEQIGCRFADHIIGQNCRIAPVQIPALEERRPINIVAQFGQIIIVKDFRAGELRLDGLVLFFGSPRIFARLTNRRSLVFSPTPRMGFRHRFIIGANFSLVIAAFFFRQEIAGNANSAAGIGHINGLALLVIRIDFYRRMHF